MHGKRRWIAGAVGVLLVLLLVEGGGRVLADDNVVIELNGQPLQPAHEPLVVDDTVYLPVRSVAEAVRTPVYWESVNRRIWLLNGARADYIELEDVEPRAASFHGEAEAFAADGVVYASLTYLADLLSLNAGWEADDGIVWLIGGCEEEAEPVSIDLDAVRSEGAEAVWLRTGGVYRISGSLDEGRLHIQTAEPVRLQLTGCDINAGDGAAVYAEGGGLVQLELVGGEANSLRSEGQAAVLVDGALEICGDGGLAVYAENGVGIRAGGYVRLAGGEVTVTAAADGVYAGELLLADAGSLTVGSEGGAALSAGRQVFVNGGELTTTGSRGVSAGNIVMINGGNLSITAADAGISAGTSSVQAAATLAENYGSNRRRGDTAAVVSLDNEADPEDVVDIASITSSELSREQHIAVNGGELVVRAGGSALASQGTIKQQGGVAVLYAAKGRALAAGGVVIYDGGTLLAAEKNIAGPSALNAASGGSWLDISLDNLSGGLNVTAGSEITVADGNGRTTWSYRAVDNVTHLTFADSQLEPEREYQVLVNAVPYTTAYAE